MEYDKKDEFGDVCRDFDDMRICLKKSAEMLYQFPAVGLYRRNFAASDSVSCRRQSTLQIF